MLEESIFKTIVKNTPLISIDLIIRNKKGFVLLGKRNNDPAKGFLFVPGGRIIKDERISEAFKRIARVEMGEELLVSEAKFKGVYEHLYTNNSFNNEFSTHYVVLAYEMQSSNESISPKDEQHSEMVWMSPEEILMHKSVHENTKAYFR